MTLRNTILLFFLLPGLMSLQAQEIDFEKVKDSFNFGRFRTIQFQGHTGGHLYSGNSLQEKVVSGYGSLTFKFGWQSRDPEIWGKYGYPTYGFGFYAGFVGDPQIFGNPNAIYSWIRFPISKPKRRNEFAITPSFGLTYNLAPFDPQTNPLNDAIGARMAVYFNMEFQFAYKWTHEMDIVYGLDFTHFSNGRTYTPNYGLNMFGLNLGLRYHFNADQRKVDKDIYTTRLLQNRFQRVKKTPNTKVEKPNSINVYAAIGTVQNAEDAGTKKRFTTFSGVLDFQHKFNNMHGATIGLDYFIDESLKEVEEAQGETWLVGIHAGYDFMFWKFTVGVHLGTYLSDNRGKANMFIRPALRYDITKWLYGQVGLKTVGGAADWVEFGIGFRPFRF